MPSAGNGARAVCRLCGNVATYVMPVRAWVYVDRCGPHQLKQLPKHDPAAGTFECACRTGCR